MPAGAVGRFQVASNPTAAVIPHQYRERPLAFGSVNANRHTARRSGNGPVFDLANLRPGCARTLAGVLTGFLRRNSVVRWQAQGAGRFDDLLSLWVQGHGEAPFLLEKTFFREMVHCGTFDSLDRIDVRIRPNFNVISD